MATLQVASDIHLEMRDIPFDRILTPSADILALVGDIGSPLNPSLEAFLTWCSVRFVMVLYVPGNHEYYNQLGIPVDAINFAIKSVCSRLPNVKYLYNDVYVHMGKYRFIGSILWSQIPAEHMVAIQHRMNDYRYIHATATRLMTPEDSNTEFDKNVAFLNGSLRDDGLVNIVLTHHTPSKIGTSPPKLSGGISEFAFSSNVDVPRGLIRLWCCGHTHYNFRHTYEGYELLSNQFGYEDQGTEGYVPDLKIIL